MRWFAAAGPSALVCVLVAGLLPGLGGCEARIAGESTESPAPQRTAAATRMYTVGEELFAQGDYAKAERLIAEAIRQVPSRTDHADLRHSLIMRLSYVQMVRADGEAALAPLDRADQMLERHAQQHEQLFGDGRSEQRDEIFEQLGQVSLLREQLQARASQGETPDQGASVEPAAPQGAAAAHAGVELESEKGWTRDVRVRRSRYGDHSEAEIRARLLDPHYDGQSGLSMTRGAFVKYSDARALVRLRLGVRSESVSGDAAEADPSARRARAWARALVASARPRLEECYADAYSRRPVAARQVAVTLELSPQGTASSVRIAAGDVVDGQGDACVVDALRHASIRDDDTAPSSAVAMRVPLLFMFEAERMLDEWTGEAASHGRFGSTWREYNPDIVQQRDSAPVTQRVPLP